MANRIIIDTSALNKVMHGLRGFEKEIPQAVQQAINRTVDHVFTRTGQIVTKHYNITNREVKDSMTKSYANRGSIYALVKIRGKRFTLARFLPGGLGSKSKVAKVKIKKSAGYKRVGGSPGAFVNDITKIKKDGTESSSTQVMRRRGNSRYPVDVMRTIATAQMVENIDVKNTIQEAANAMLAKRVEHEVERRLRRTIR